MLDELDNVQFLINKVLPSVLHLSELTISLGSTEKCDPEVLTNDWELGSLGD